MKKKLNNKKRFEDPKLKIILFTNDDIITDSGEGDPYGEGDDWNQLGF